MLEGLNDNTLAELDTVTVDKDGIAVTGTAPVAANSATAILDTSLSQEEQSKDVELLPLIEKHDLWIQTENDKKTELARLQDVAATIMAAESISRTDIANAFASINDEALLSQFTNEVSVLAGFTELQTKTNLDETKHFFNARMTAAETSLEEHYALLRQESYASLLDTYKAFIVYTDKVIGQLDELQEIAGAAWQQATATKNAIVLIAERDKSEGGDYVEKKAADIRYMGFNWQLDKAQAVLKLDVSVYQDFSNTYRNNRALLKSIMKIDQVRAGKVEYFLKHPGAKQNIEQNHSGLDYIKLLSIYMSGRLANGLAFLQASLQQAIQPDSQEEGKLELSNADLSALQASLLYYGQALSVISSLNAQALLIIRSFRAIL